MPSQMVENAVLVVLHCEVNMLARPAKVQKWKCVRPSAIQEKGQFFRGGGGSIACDAAFV